MLNLKRFMARLFAALLVLGSLAGSIRAGEPVLERETWYRVISTGADVFSSSLTIPNDSSLTKVRTYRVTAEIDGTVGTNAILYVRRTCVAASLILGGSQATQHTGQASNGALNSATALTAGNVYAFDVTATRGVSLNFRVGTSTVFRYFMVQRIEEGN